MRPVPSAAAGYEEKRQKQEKRDTPEKTCPSVPPGTYRELAKIASSPQWFQVQLQTGIPTIAWLSWKLPFPKTCIPTPAGILQSLAHNCSVETPQNRAFAANSLNGCSEAPLDAKGPSASSHSKYGIAHYHHYYRPTWHLWLFTESRLYIILCPQNIPWNYHFHHQKLNIQSLRIKKGIHLCNKTKCSCHSCYCVNLYRFSIGQWNSTTPLQK